MFENKSYKGIYYSRFIASYAKYQKIDYSFKHWLQQIKIDGEVLPDEVIFEIYDLATNGKLELETNAHVYLHAL